MGPPKPASLMERDCPHNFDTNYSAGRLKSFLRGDRKDNLSDYLILLLEPRLLPGPGNRSSSSSRIRDCDLHCVKCSLDLG